MFTREELRAIPLFVDLAQKELDYLSKTSADIRLQPGEYVAHEGDARREMFILTDGRVEVTKFVDGVERVVGVRGPGELFGEVPVILGTPFLASFRAIETSRVMSIEQKDFRVVAAASPKVLATVEAAALDRVSGLQDLAAEPPKPLLVVIGPQWDNGTHELREFLHRNSVLFDWMTPEDPEASSSLDLSSEARYPIVRLRDGTLHREPSIGDVAKAIGLCILPTRKEYDVAIVGGGPAGLAAAVYGSSEGLSVVLIESEAPGGQAGTSSRIENYLGFPFGISGDELAHRALQQAKRLGAEIVVTRTVRSIDVDSHMLLMDGGDSIRAKTIILATGVAWRQLDIASLDPLRGRGVYYGAAPDEARLMQGKDIYLIGGGNSAGQAALNFSNFANSVTLLIRGESLAKSMSYYLIEQLKTKANVHVETRAEVTGVQGKDHLEEVIIFNNATREATRRPASALFIMIGADAQTVWLPTAIQLDERGYVVTGPKVVNSGRWPIERDPYLLETTVPGIFAVGDVRAGSVKRVAASVGEGSMVIAFVHQYLTQTEPTLQPLPAR